jgi:hypothetical protein
MSEHVLDRRLAILDWAAIEQSLDQNGCATITGLLDAAVCDKLSALYGHQALFRSHVLMARHGFGQCCEVACEQCRIYGCKVQSFPRSTLSADMRQARHCRHSRRSGQLANENWIR